MKPLEELRLLSDPVNFNWIDSGTQLTIVDCSIVTAAPDFANSVLPGPRWADKLFFGDPSRGVVKFHNSRWLIAAEVCIAFP